MANIPLTPTTSHVENHLKPSPPSGQWISGVRVDQPPKDAFLNHPQILVVDGIGFTCSYD